jgi:hypothetical protein
MLAHYIRNVGSYLKKCCLISEEIFGGNWRNVGSPLKKCCLSSEEMLATEEMLACY